MINPFREVNWQPGPAEKRKFAWSLIIGFPCLAVVSFCVRRLVTGAWSMEPALWLGGIGLGLGLLLITLPVMARPFYVIWYFLACSIGIVVGNILVTAFYYLLLTPLGLLLRLVRRTPLRKGPDKKMASYWQEAEQITDPQRYFRQF